MFGSKKRLSKEQIAELQERVALGDEIVERLVGQKGMINNSHIEIQKSQSIMKEDLAQSMESVDKIYECADEDAKAVATMIYNVEEYQKQMREAEAVYHSMQDSLKRHAGACQELVEQGKYFTTPSKQLGEIPSELHQQNQKYCVALAQMEECGRQMGVLALNAAIEAGRMGDSGHSFVNAAEHVRGLATQYSDAATALIEEITRADKRVKQLEDTIHHIVSLMKENNVSARDIMVSSQAIVKMTEDTAIRDFSEDLTPLRSDMAQVRGREEELIKIAERGRMRVDDLNSEYNVQKTNADDMMKMLGEALQIAGQYHDRMESE